MGILAWLTGDRAWSHMTSCSFGNLFGASSPTQAWQEPRWAKSIRVPFYIILPYFSDFTRCPQRSTRFVICWLFLPSFLPNRLDMLGTCNSSLNFEQVLLPSQKMGDMNWLAESRDVCVCVSMHLAHGLPLIFASMASILWLIFPLYVGFHGLTTLRAFRGRESWEVDGIKPPIVGCQQQDLASSQAPDPPDPLDTRSPTIVFCRIGAGNLHVATCHQTMLREPVHLTWTILEKLKCPWNLLSSRLTTRKRLLRH